MLDNRDLITHLEVEWQLKGIYPDTQTLLKEFGCKPSELKRAEPQVQTALAARGLPVPAFNFKGITENEPPAPTVYRFDPFFVAAVSLLVNTTDKRSKEAKLKAVGLSSEKFNNFLQDERHYKYFKARVEKVFGSTEVDAQLGLKKLVEGADLNAIKYFNEMTNVYRPGQEQQFNLILIIHKLMEILAKHLTPEVLSSVADELDSVLEVKGELV